MSAALPIGAKEHRRANDTAAVLLKEMQRPVDSIVVVNEDDADRGCGWAWLQRTSGHPQRRAKGRAVAQLSFQPGEVVVRELRPSPLATIQLYVVTLGLWEIWRRRTRFVLTNQRVIISRGVLNRAVRFVPLDRVQDATLRNQLWVASIHLSSAGGPGGVEQLRLMRTRDARIFLEDLTPRIGPSAPGGLKGSSNGTLIADELRKLAQLRDQGVLSPEEFESQKAKLLL
jgi:hypothetical protein